MYLSQYELAILRSLRVDHETGGEGMSQHDLSEATDLPPFTVKATLAALRRIRIVRRDMRYRFTITNHGLGRLNQTEQLRVVR